MIMEGVYFILGQVGFLAVRQPVQLCKCVKSIQWLCYWVLLEEAVQVSKWSV
jgi:hypothetical protein